MLINCNKIKDLLWCFARGKHDIPTMHWYRTHSEGDDCQAPPRVRPLALTWPGMHKLRTFMPPPLRALSSYDGCRVLGWTALSLCASTRHSWGRCYSMPALSGILNCLGLYIRKLESVQSRASLHSEHRSGIGPAVRADFRRLYPANAKTPTCCPSDDNRTKVTNSVTSARSLWWHAGPYFWPADLTRTANPIATAPPLRRSFSDRAVTSPEGAFQTDTNLANHRHRTKLLAHCQWPLSMTVRIRPTSKHAEFLLSVSTHISVTFVEACSFWCLHLVNLLTLKFLTFRTSFSVLHRLPAMSISRAGEATTKTTPRDRRKLIKLMLRKCTFLPPRSHLIGQFVKRHLVTIRREQHALAQWLRQYFAKTTACAV